MWRLVFLVPFIASLSRRDIDYIASSLDLTLNRTDDWDSQIAFSLLGKTGSLRLFRRDDEKEQNSYEFFGTAGEEEDVESVAQYFDRCKQVVYALKGQIYESRVMAPPGQNIALHG